MTNFLKTEQKTNLTKHFFTFNVENTLQVKPTEDWFNKQISNSIKTPLELSIEEISKLLIYPCGNAFSPCIFENNKRLNSNWLYSSCFVLDFDCGITPEFVKQQLFDWGIKSNIIYNSFSDSESLRKFRVLIFVDKLLIDKIAYKNCLQALMYIIEHTDENCKDYARFFYGGKNLLHLDTIPNNFESFVGSINTALCKKDKGQTRNFVFKENIPQKIETYTNEEGTEVKISVDLKANNLYDGKPIQKFNYDKLSKNCKLFREFVDLERRLKYKELEGVILNLKFVKGGKKYITDIFNKSKGTKAEYIDRDYFMISALGDNQKYLPMKLKNFSPYEEDWKYNNLIVASGYSPNNQLPILIIEKKPKMKLTSAENLMVENFLRVLNEGGNKIYLFKLPTGIGKTEMLKLLQNYEKSFVIANPYHTLKNETFERLKDFVCGLEKTPELYKFSEGFQNQIDLNYELGLISEVKDIIEDKAREFTTPENKEDVEKSKKYLEELKKALNSQRILTTHKRLITQKIHRDLTIVDEDPIYEIFKTDYISLKELENFLKALNRVNEHNKKLNIENRNKKILEISKSIDLKFSKGKDEKFKQIQDLKKRIENLKKLNKIENETNYIEEDFSFFGKDDIEEIKKSINCFTASKKYYIKKTKKVLEVFKNPIGFNASKIINFFNSSYYIFNNDNGGHIHFVQNKKDFFFDKKTIILSATADVNLYKRIFEERLEVFEIDNVEQKGTIVQITQHSNTRTSLKTEGRLERLSEMIGDKKVITFKNLKTYFKNALEDVHFGKSCGIDKYNGSEEGVVIGTPFPPHEQVMLYAAAIGVPITLNNQLLEIKEVEINGYKIKFNSYVNDVMKEIQFGIINGELVQAIGRFRALRNDCVVVVISKFPLKETDEFILAYPQDIEEIIEKARKNKKVLINTLKPFIVEYKDMLVD